MYNPKNALPMKNFPFTFRESDWKTAELASQSAFQRFISEVKSKGCYYVYKDNGEVIDRLLEDGYGIVDLEAIDFPKWIDSSFNKKEAPPTSKILYIYNVGMEVGKTGFSDTVLNAIVVNNLNKGNTVIIASNDLTLATFKRNYPNSAKHVKLGRQILK